MNLRVKLLHLVDGIDALGSRKTIAVVDTPGVPTALSIKRLGAGYVIGWNTRGQDRLFFIPDSRVLCAEVELDEDEAPAKAKKA